MDRTRLFLLNLTMAIIAVVVGLLVHPGVGIALAFVFVLISIRLSRTPGPE
jgi:hypothetical protein